MGLEAIVHPHAEWTRERLESYVGTTETLTLEFKSYQALLPGDGRDREQRMKDAAKDVAGMANEQGGIIIYGIDEQSGGGFRRARAVEEGFAPEHSVSSEWFLQFIQHRVQPPLTDIDAVDVLLGGDRRALVILVPQARGSARQTEDYFFWRRDAHGLRRMSAQEIEDVRLRSIRPKLSINFVPALASLADERRLFQAQAQFGILNESTATAQFAVITVGLCGNASARNLGTGWRWLTTSEEWKILRGVIASGSCDYWSPITPGFTLVAQPVEIVTPILEKDWVDDPRPVGLVRLDHDGGATTYRLRFSVRGNPKLLLDQVTAIEARALWSRVPELFFLPY